MPDRSVLQGYDGSAANPLKPVSSQPQPADDLKTSTIRPVADTSGLVMSNQTVFIDFANAADSESAQPLWVNVALTDYCIPVDELLPPVKYPRVG